jgi:hypothetical protein
MVKLLNELDYGVLVKEEAHVADNDVVDVGK